MCGKHHSKKALNKSWHRASYLHLSQLHSLCPPRMLQRGFHSRHVDVVWRTPNPPNNRVFVKGDLFMKLLPLSRHFATWCPHSRKSRLALWTFASALELSGAFCFSGLFWFFFFSLLWSIQGISSCKITWELLARRAYHMNQGTLRSSGGSGARLMKSSRESCDRTRFKQSLTRPIGCQNGVIWSITKSEGQKPREFTQQPQQYPWAQRKPRRTQPQQWELEPRHLLLGRTPCEHQLRMETSVVWRGTEEWRLWFGGIVTAFFAAIHMGWLPCHVALQFFSSMWWFWRNWCINVYSRAGGKEHSILVCTAAPAVWSQWLFLIAKVLWLVYHFRSGW